MIAQPSHTAHDSASPELAVDLTPLLDILFILIVFFLLTAGAVFHSFDLELPKSVSDSLTLNDEPKHILLEIQAQDYRIDGVQMANFESFKNAIQQATANKPDHGVVIASEKSASIDRLMQLLTYLQANGIETANILMLKEQNET